VGQFGSSGHTHTIKKYNELKSLPAIWMGRLFYMPTLDFAIYFYEYRKTIKYQAILPNGGAMIEDKSEKFFTKKHANLTRLAIIANIFAWISLFANFLLMYTRTVQFQYTYYRCFGQPVGGFWELLKLEPQLVIDILMQLATIFVTGIVFFLVLKGISLGLNMIVETDLNYRQNSQE
jgi:hypothetical protein